MREGIDACTAYFGGKVIEGNTTFVRQHVLLKIADGGEPGIRMDKVFSAVVNDLAIFSPFCEDPESAVIESEWDLVVGNLQLHYL